MNMTCSSKKPEILQLIMDCRW